MKRIYYALFYAPLIMFLAVFLNPFGPSGTVFIVLCAFAVIVPLVFKIMTAPGKKKVPWTFVVIFFVALGGIVALSFISLIK